jgi:hypothetical protein
VEIAALIEAITLHVADLRRVGDDTPLGFYSGALFGYAELLSAAHVGDYDIKPRRGASQLVDGCIFWSMVAVIALGGWLLGRKST